ncbi:hypothetical protein CANARDRAFT_174758 [[Candida] arabinofermentans NRRL YB-2248]|uniref:Oligomycin resistance ATP-dependent permease YOR1 n=1 Tax=[Candida] arabinofermentans NRRL YB-2248 TaxID=983967 RepID=A0A1E4T4L1_9ASCO|nr:hypothetical protein CANARDRAFT_174758 [[Candida] arabinofermentans NRRL YB-2248]
MTPFFLDKRYPPIPTEDERTTFPMHSASLLSKTFFWWLTPLLVTGYKRKLFDTDFWTLDPQDSVDTLAEKFKIAFETRLTKARNEFNERNNDSKSSFVPPKNILIWSLVDTFGWNYMLTCNLRLSSDLLSCFTPLLSKELIKLVEKSAAGLPTSKGRAVGYAIGVTIFIVLRGLLLAHYFNHGAIIGAKIKSVLTKAVYDKSFKLKSEDRLTKFPSGKIISIVTQDLARTEMALTYFGTMFAFPFVFIITIVLLCINVGATGLVGIAIFVIGLGIIVYFSKGLLKYRIEATKYTDLRVGAIKEVLNNLKMIKFYCWEASYLNKIKNYRFKEMNQILYMQSIRGAVMALSFNLTNVSSMLTFVCMFAASGMKNVANIFTGLTFFTILSGQILVIPMTLSSSIDAYVGCGRVANLLLCEDDEFNDFQINDEMGNEAISITNGEFSWDIVNTTDTDTSTDKENLENKTFTGLHQINLSIQKGEFVVITGTIGSGKSSLLSAISRQMKLIDGSIKTNGSLVLCGYTWVQNSTVKENILFGSPFDKLKYEKIVECCCLQSDFDQLPDGDLTFVGERGITLSGGQKARINLARAVYADRDILLMDDVLSAVDAKVGKHIMNEGILGLLNGKTRILATHQLSLIGSADRVIFMNSNGTIDVGSIDELKKINNDFAQLMVHNHDQALENEAEEDDNSEEFETENGGDSKLSKLRSSIQLKSQEEVTSADGISYKVYLAYLKLSPGFLKFTAFPLLLGSLIISTFLSLFTNVWLTYWTNYSFPLSNSTYEGLYALFTVLALLLTIVTFCMVSYLNNNSSRTLHLMSLDKIIRAPLSYMDITPMGRILNRFTKDTDVTDNELGDQLRLLLYASSFIVGVLILCICYFPWFAIAIPFLVLMYLMMANIYLASSRDISRMEASRRSKIFNNVNESLTGMNTIKSFGSNSIDRFIVKNSKLIDQANEISFITISNQRWLAAMLCFVSLVLTLVVTLLCVFNVFGIGAAETGLLINYVLQISNFLSFVVRSATLVESRMTSVERLIDYAYDLPQESLTGEAAPENWPTKGDVQFDHVSMRYRPELPLVLDDCSLKIKGGSRLGVCGRTGAGKSTILSSLYRLNEIESSGCIRIDGIDISTLKLDDLRSKLSIIPQDPILFSGSIRDNLDPFKQRTDDEIWDALRRSGLIDKDDLERVKFQETNNKSLHKFHLSQLVEDGGTNFSLGERQLLALARALVRRSKILILDEATSSVDYETDAKIQATIENEFVGCTILCIAHRLKTIVNYDNILVLEQGKVSQFGKPVELFNESSGIFREMCLKSNIGAQDFTSKS